MVVHGSALSRWLSYVIHWKDSSLLISEKFAGIVVECNGSTTPERDPARFRANETAPNGISGNGGATRIRDHA
jgi:hypothetical protein